MIAPHVVDAIAAEEIEIGAPFPIIQVRTLRPSIDLVEPNDPLHCDQRGVQVPLVKLVILAEACLDDLLDVEWHEMAGGGYAGRAVFPVVSAGVRVGPATGLNADDKVSLAAMRLSSNSWFA